MELQTPTIPALDVNFKFSGPLTDLFASLTPTSFSFFANGISIPPQVVWLIFWVTLSVFAAMSLVLFFHWENFEFDKVIVRWMTLLYTGGGAAILYLIYRAVSAYSTSL